VPAPQVQLSVGTGLRGRYAGVRAYAAYGEAPITRCPCELHDRDAGCARRTAPRLRSHMRRPDPPLAARGHWQSAVTALQDIVRQQKMDRVPRKRPSRQCLIS
jgi:hypothetical protein